LRGASRFSRVTPGSTEQSHARSTAMLQKIFEKSENTAVLVTVLAFIIFHFGMLFLLKIV
jgi:hypothetical protein